MRCLSVLPLLLLAGLGAGLLPGAASAQNPFKIHPNDPSSFDDFGRSIAMDGTRILVGSVGDDDNGSVSGSAYLFDAITGQQLRKLLPGDGAPVDNFGIDVDLDGSRCIVGAYTDDDLGNDAGSAYVFDTTTGQQLFKLLPLDGAAGDNFGVAVAISGAAALVGAWKHDHNGVNDTGAVYVFDLTTGQQVHKIVPSSVDADDQFGRAVALEGFRAVVGAYFRDGVGSGSGGAYVLDVLTGSVLDLLVPGDTATEDRHGWSVAMDGDRALVSSPYRSDNGSRSGAVYLYDLGTGSVLAKYLASDAAANDYYGWAVAMDGNLGVVGAPFADPNGSESGAAYLIDLSTGQEIEKLVPADGVAEARCGYDMAIRGTTVLSSAYHDDDHGKYSGSVYAYDVCPDSLTLDAGPDVALAGDPLYFMTSGGVPGLLNAVVVTAVNGAPFWFIVVRGSFDFQCRHTFGATTPSGLAGLDITFQSVGFAPAGLSITNAQVLQFQ